jgi:hypothetical protein
MRMAKCGLITKSMIVCFDMKKLLILLFSILIASCVDSVDPERLDFSSDTFCEKSPKVEVRDGLFYLLNQQEPYSGENICVYKSNGQYYIQGVIKKGLRYGKQTKWYENGQIGEEGNFIDGKEDGKWTYWYENGQIMMEASGINGKEDGKWTMWYENGQIMMEGNFIDGKEDGKQTVWDENGQIEGEAIYKNGECISGDCDYFEDL